MIKATETAPGWSFEPIPVEIVIETMIWLNWYTFPWGEYVELQ